MFILGLNRECGMLFNGDQDHRLRHALYNGPLFPVSLLRVLNTIL